jgi:hypothetical protein
MKFLFAHLAFLSCAHTVVITGSALATSHGNATLVSSIHATNTSTAGTRGF